MNKKISPEFTIWGFKFNTKNTLVGFSFFIFFIALLLIIDTFITSISWYGVIIGCGFILAIILATKLLPMREINEDLPYYLIWWVFPFSIVGARMYYVLTSLNEFSNFWQMLEIWNGGLGIYGGIIGGFIGLVIGCYIKKVKIIDTCDCVAPCLIIAQAIGRWGNFVNQEVYGFEITNQSMQWFPFGVFISKNGINEWHLATFFYESILNTVGFFFLIWLLKKVKIKGINTCAYLIFYGIVRYFLEGLRVVQYQLMIPGTNFPISQLVSILCVIGGVIGIISILIVNNKKKEQSNK